MFRSLLTAIALALVTVGLAQDYHTDARLKKAVSLHLKIVPLSTFVKQFSQVAGVPMGVAPNIADRKITVIFKDRPAAEAMDKVAETFFCTWAYDGSAYRLLMSRDDALQESRLLDSETDALKKRLQEYVGNLTAMAVRPREQVLAEQKDLGDQIRALQSRKDSESKNRLKTLRAAYEKVANAQQWDLGYSLKASPNVVATLLTGTTLFASTKKNEGLPLAASAVPQMQIRVMVPGVDGKPTSELRAPGGAVMAIRMNLISGELETMTMATGLGDTAAGGNGAKRQILDSWQVEQMLKDEPLKKRLRNWGTNDNGSLLARKLPQSTTAKSAGYAQKAYTLSDHLEYLADTAGIPVVSDAFRIPVSSETYMSAGTVGEYMDRLRTDVTVPMRSPYLRTNGGWLMARHPHYWRLLLGELPESVFQPIESKVSSGQMPDLDDYAAFAIGLTPYQAEAFSDNPPLTRFPRLPLIDAMPALRLWGALNGSQRQAAGGDGLTIQEMTPAQRDLLRAAAIDLLWQRPVKESFTNFLMHGVAGSQIKLFVRDGESGFQVRAYRRQDAYGEVSNGPMTPEQLATFRQRSIGFIVGENADSGESFGLILPVKE